MTSSKDWLPSREQDFVDLCEKWNIALKKADNITGYGWNTDAVGEVLVCIKVFLEARQAALCLFALGNQHKHQRAVWGNC